LFCAILFNSETWHLSLKEERVLHVSENKVLTKYWDLGEETVIWTKLRNSSLFMVQCLAQGYYDRLNMFLRWKKQEMQKQIW